MAQRSPRPQPSRRPKGSDREHDVVVFGATGFAGRLTAEYLARNAPADCRWALAGRSADKLAKVRDDLGVDVPVVVADVEDERSLRELAGSTRVVATTVGPYVLYGDGLVAACAAAGTDYLDLTGEPEFVDVTYVRHHATAVDTGARLVHAAGFDSIPHDLGALFTVLQLPEDVPITVSGYVRASASFSGGTFHSLVTAASRPRQNVTAARERREREGRPDAGRRARARRGKPHRAPVERRLGRAAADPRSAGRRPLGPRTPPVRPGLRLLALRGRPPPPHGGRGCSRARRGRAGCSGAARPPCPAQARRAGGRAVPEKRARSWFTVTFVGEGGGERVVTRVSGGDPGYDETAKMLAESALCLALDDLPRTAGQVTTATAMGEAAHRAAAQGGHGVRGSRASPGRRSSADPAAVGQ